jgi:hypothetical protein
VSIRSGMGSDEFHGGFDLDDQRKSDAYLLNKLNVETIFDLMVETHKKVYGIRVSSSEKAEPRRYASLDVVPAPFPGCEFFRVFKKNDRNGSGFNMMYDWSLEIVNSIVKPSAFMKEIPDIDWTRYKEWDLVEMTRNYLRAIYHTLGSKSRGVLVHCVSGWDRTPLFVSLLRLSLWADGLIHQSLNEEEMLYFTLSYDWMLFSHQLSDRIYKKEEIMYFCFYFLQFIEEFDQLKEPPPDDDPEEKLPFDLSSKVDVINDHFAVPRAPVLERSMSDNAGQLESKKGIPIPARISGDNGPTQTHSAHSHDSAYSGSWEVIPPLGEMVEEMGRRSRENSSVASVKDYQDSKDFSDALGSDGDMVAPNFEMEMDPAMLKIVQYSPSDVMPSALARWESKKKPIPQVLQAEEEPTAFFYDQPPSRKERLSKIREMFIKLYAEVIDAHEAENTVSSSPSAASEATDWD